MTNITEDKAIPNYTPTAEPSANLCKRDSEYDRDTYSYNLPEELIAQQPLSERDASRLLQRSRNGQRSHHAVKDLIELLPYGSHLIFNNSKVIPARVLAALETGAKVEVFLLEPSKNDPRIWQCLAKPAKKLKPGVVIKLPGAAIGRVVCNASLSEAKHGAQGIGRDSSLAAQNDGVLATKNDGVLAAKNDGVLATKNDGVLATKNDGVLATKNDSAASVMLSEAKHLAHPNAGEQTKTLHIKFEIPNLSIYEWLNQYGQMPLPPYIKRDKQSGDVDKLRYQTTYANPIGSVAAPTAGLHFSEALIAALGERGISHSFVTLHVGAGTFLPIKSQDIRSHHMHEERYTVSSDDFTKWQDTKAKGRPLIAVGTTTFRTIESLGRLCNYDPQKIGSYLNCEQRTSLFIHPEQGRTFKPWLIDALFTNFHQPESTLYMLIAALIGLDEVRQLYREAIEHRYRFFSYGDANLLWL